MASRHEEGWDQTYHQHCPQELPWELGKPREGLVKLVNSERVQPGKTLDLCCGAGSNTVYLAEKGFKVTTLDISDKAVFYAKDKARKSEVSINFLIGNFTSLPFKAHEFDFAFDFGCFHHVPAVKRTTYIKGVYRVLKPKAACFLVCFSDKNGVAWNHLRKAQIRELFQDWFKIEQIDHV
jgi:ubiquinone/menaquinone biosynthesis C-methylase UbiE